MGILGLTHDKSGMPFENLPVTIKVAIGDAPAAGQEDPRKLDHFIFKRRTQRGSEVVWAPDEEINRLHGDKPTELGVIFLHEDATEAFRTEYAWWTNSICKCRGELVQIADGGSPQFAMQAVRKTQRYPQGEPWPGRYRYVSGRRKGEPVEACGENCPDLNRGACRPSGDLYFVLEKFPRYGAICRLHTSSYRSVRNLSNGLMQIQRMRRGSLSGVRARLKASPETVWYRDREGTMQSSVAYILSIEMTASELRKSPSNGEPHQPARSHAFADGSELVEPFSNETEAERAKELAAEFYPRLVTSRAPEVAAVPTEEDDQLGKICELARRAGLNDAKTKMLIGQCAGNLAELERKLLNAADENPA